MRRLVGEPPDPHSSSTVPEQDDEGSPASSAEGGWTLELGDRVQAPAHCSAVRGQDRGFSGPQFPQLRDGVNHGSSLEHCQWGTWDCSCCVELLLFSSLVKVTLLLGDGSWVLQCHLVSRSPGWLWHGQVPGSAKEQGCGPAMPRLGLGAQQLFADSKSIFVPLSQMP